MPDMTRKPKRAHRMSWPRYWRDIRLLSLRIPLLVVVHAPCSLSPGGSAGAWAGSDDRASGGDRRAGVWADGSGAPGGGKEQGGMSRAAHVFGYLCICVHACELLACRVCSGAVPVYHAGWKYTWGRRYELREAGLKVCVSCTSSPGQMCLWCYVVRCAGLHPVRSRKREGTIVLAVSSSRPLSLPNVQAGEHADHKSPRKRRLFVHV